ncbi:MAG: hypothetical protein ACFNOO_04045, partial [Segatella oulorum]
LINHLENITEKTFVIKRSVFQNCLEVYPLCQWNGVMEKLNELNRFVRKNADFIRIFTAGVKNIHSSKSIWVKIERVQVLQRSPTMKKNNTYVSKWR